MLADMDGVLVDDYHASTTAIIYRALEIQLGGMKGIDRLIMSRDADI
jgi:beta-phosphoglucomutase-like phosphatase (HAD superfamily)